MPDILRSPKIILLAAAFGCWSGVRAQDAAPAAPAADDLGEIVVTARQRTERLLDVPVAVTVIGAADMNRTRPRNSSTSRRSRRRS